MKALDFSLRKYDIRKNNLKNVSLDARVKLGMTTESFLLVPTLPRGNAKTLNLGTGFRRCDVEGDECGGYLPSQV